jgi:four helix bundle protein
MNGYKDLVVWQRGMSLVFSVYEIVSSFPAEERFALGDQMRRSVVSIPSNIAEGYARDSKKEFRHFLAISAGSLAELETQLLICQHLNYCSTEKVTAILNQVDEIRKMLIGLRKKLSCE